MTTALCLRTSAARNWHSARSPPHLSTPKPQNPDVWN